MTEINLSLYEEVVPILHGTYLLIHSDIIFENNREFIGSHLNILC